MSTAPERFRLDTPEHRTLAVKRLSYALAHLVIAVTMQQDYRGAKHVKELERRMKEARELLATLG